MFYNLCYGALDDAKTDGVSNRWFLYKNNKHSDIDKLDLSNDWKSDIYLLDPANKDWQNYIIERNNEVYNNLDFDGFHIDQVGDRGTVYETSMVSILIRLVIAALFTTTMVET